MDTVQFAQWALQNTIIVDTETTGLGEHDVVIELAAIDCASGEKLADTLVYTDKEISEEAENINGISAQMIKNAPPIQLVLDELTETASRQGKTLSAYNLVFDRRLIIQSYPLITQQQKDQFSLCVMELANRHFAKDHAIWDYSRSQFKRLSLQRCLEIAGIERVGTAHRAWSDVVATRDLLIYIAGGGK